MSGITFVRLTFKNPDAVRRVISVLVDAASVDDVVEWYKSHHAGDRITVTKEPGNAPTPNTTAKETGND
jgi:hypothetical protein